MLTLQSQASCEQLPGPCPASQVSDIPEAQISTLGRRTETEAEACFRRAIEVARKQEARSWELRATVSLARLWDQQGKRREAHQMLANIYGWFTEGFDTADLKNAKVLLDDLTA